MSLQHKDYRTYWELPGSVGGILMSRCESPDTDALHLGTGVHTAWTSQGITAHSGSRGILKIKWKYKISIFRTRSEMRSKDVKPRSSVLCVRAEEAAGKAPTMQSLDQNCSESQTRSWSCDLHNKISQVTKLLLKLEQISMSKAWQGKVAL